MKKIKTLIALVLALLALPMCFFACEESEPQEPAGIHVNISVLDDKGDPFVKTGKTFTVAPETSLVDAVSALCTERNATYEISPTTGEFIKFTFDGKTIETEEKLVSNKENDAGKKEYQLIEFIVYLNGTKIKNDEIAGIVLNENDTVDIKLTAGEPFWA